MRGLLYAAYAAYEAVGLAYEAVGLKRQAWGLLGL